MIKLTDTVENTSLVYLFIKEFVWDHPENNENNVGHPKKGKIYRAAFNKDTKSYRLFYNSPDGNITGIFLPTLTAVPTDDFLAFEYTSEIVELTRHNLLEQNILEEDLDEFVKWIDEDNATIKKIMGFPANQEQPKVVSVQEIINTIAKNQEDKDRLEFLQRLGRLNELNPPIFQAIVNLVDFLLTSDNEPGLDSMVDTGWIGFSKTLGAGKNLADALQHLSRYGGESRRTNLMQADLLNAIKSLLAEQARRNFHDIHE